MTISIYLFYDTLHSDTTSFNDVPESDLLVNATFWSCQNIHIYYQKFEMFEDLTVVSPLNEQKF